MNPKARLSFFAGTIALALVCTGCMTKPEAPEKPEVIPEVVERARALFDEDKLTDAIIACTKIHRDDPLTPGLAKLEAEITQRLADLRKRATTAKRPSSEAIASEDIDRNGILPETYRLRKHVLGETDPIHTLPLDMQKLLAKPVTIHLENVPLSAIVAQIGAAENVNIVADGQLDGPTMTIHVEKTPLTEVLEYIGRNLGVTFAIGQNIIWVTEGNDQVKGMPLYTRIYRLRKGISKEEIEKGLDSLGIIEAVTRFIPETEGADILFNKRAHALLVKNTRDNLALIEDIIEALDIRPPQVHIEARFMSTSVTDLRELGVDWFLDSNYVLRSDKKGDKLVIGGGTGTDAAGAGASIAHTPFANGTVGLNFNFTGVLTDPAFHAVIHALEENGTTRTLSVPRVTAVNNTEAKLRVGEDFRYFEEYEVEEIRTGTNDNGNETYESRLVPTGTPTLEELGIELVVTPSVGADLATIDLKLQPEISEFVRWEYYETADSVDANNDNDDDDDDDSKASLSMIKLPVFRRSTIDTEVLVRSGETVIMGGLITSARTKAEYGVPFLSKIPYVGRFFRHDVWENVSQNLLIFVTATLISDSGEELIPLNPPEPVTGGGKVELGQPPLGATTPGAVVRGTVTPAPAAEAPAPANP